MTLSRRTQILVYVVPGSYLAHLVLQARANGTLTGRYLAELDVEMRQDLDLSNGVHYTRVDASAQRVVACPQLGGQTWN